MSTTTIEKPMTVSEAARRLGISRAAAYKLVDDGEMPHNRIGRTIRITEEQLARFQQHVAQTPAWAADESEG
jgi:excisionase family DNA binding protein